MSKLYFTLTAGRTGSAWLAEFLGHNLGLPAIHEPLEIDDFGISMPNIRLMRRFNTFGFDAEISRFWDGKLSNLPLDSGYIETNHTLGKCGLIEALAEHPRKTDATIIILRRDIAKQVASYMMRSDFENITIAWQWYLAPNYPNLIVNPSLFANLGAAGIPMWYAHEMQCRQLYYSRKFGSDIHFVDTKLEEVTRPEGAATLLRSLGIETAPQLPAKRNANAQSAPEELISQIRKALDRISFDTEEAVSNFMGHGRRLDVDQQQAA